MKANTNPFHQQALSILKKIISIIFFLLVFYVLPLINQLQLLLNWQVIFLAALCTILYATQPRVSLTESKKKKATDRNTMLLITIVSGIGQIISIIEWAYFRQTKISLSYWTIAGGLLLLSGTIFRLYAIHTLGKYFTATVQIRHEHKIIATGPYRFLRHPSYTGAFIAMLGSALFLQSMSGILIFGIGMLYVYYLRINTEEQTLLQNFGESYTKYSRHTWRMFPWVW